MKVCLTALEKDLNSRLDPRFGRCRYFIIVDLDTLEFEALDNTATISVHGAGIQAAQIVMEKGIEAVITGNIGPNAYQALSTTGIKIITGVTGTVKELVERYKKGEFKSASGFTVPAHSGIGSKRGAGIGMGMGRGLGRRQSNAFGANYQIYESFQSQKNQKNEVNQKPEDELLALKDYKESLEEELEGIKERLKELKGSMEKSTKK